MAKKYLIGVDLGTSATKASIYTLDGRMIAEASREVPMYTPAPGVVEQENEDFFQSAAQTVSYCVRESGIRPGDVAAIAFDSQMAGIGAVDETYHPAIRFDSWLDMRCKPMIDWMETRAGDLVTRLTGCAPTCDHGPKMLWWKHERPEEFRRVVKFLTPSAFVAGKLAGLRGDQAFMDASFIHFSGFANAREGTWSEEICDAFDFDMEKLPRIVEPWEVIGEIRPGPAADFGLAPGIPIAAGAGDTAANALGAGIVQPGMLFDVAGTASVLAGCTDQYIADTHHRALLTMRSILPGLWHPLAYIAGGGLALRWFRDQFYNFSRGQAGTLESDLYDEMIRSVEEIAPGCEGLFFSPHLGGRVCPANPEMRGAWVGFSWGHRQAHMMRSILESVAFEYAYYLRILRESIPALDLFEARAVGGGARSRIWNQIKADVLGVPYQRLQREEFGTWGAALVAGKAAGVIDNLAESASQAAEREEEPCYPNQQANAVYSGLVDRFIHFENQMSQYFKE
jgi:xylulokinase